MKYVICLAALLVFVSVSVSAQEDEQYETWMKSAAGAVGNLRKNIDAKAGDAAAADAKKAQEAFAQIEGYWKAKKADDAVKFAADAQAGLKEAGEMASAGKFTEAGDALKKAQTNCTGCHNAHREKDASGAWKIK